MSSTSQPGTSLLGVVQTWYSNLPLCTKATFSLITGVFVVQLLTGWYGNQAIGLSLAPYAVLYHFQVYRIFTAVLIHGGLLHVTFNMLAFVPMSASLERTVGTLQLLHFLLISCLLEGCLYVAISVLMATSGLIPGALMRGAMGFSGVIFGLIAWDSALSPAPLSIFGLFQVPAAWYPWMLLLFCQLLLPETSFFGHLAGLLIGQLWVWGYLRPLALSRPATLWLEQSSFCARCIRLSSFIVMPSSLPYTTYDSARGSPGLGGGGTGCQGSSSSSGGGGVRLGGPGRNLMTLGKLWRSGGGVAGGGGEGSGGGGDVEAGGASTDGSQGRGAFVGAGRVLGSSAGSSVVAGATAQAPSVAAALAAEARIGGSSGVMGGGGVGGSSSGNGGGAGGVSAVAVAVASGGSKTTASRDKASKS